MAKSSDGYMAKFDADYPTVRIKWLHLSSDPTLGGRTVPQAKV